MTGNYLLKNSLMVFRKLILDSGLTMIIKVVSISLKLILVISINTVHNLEYDECARALQEIERVSRKDKYVILDAYRNNEQKERMLKWNLTAKTILNVDDWVEMFNKYGYTGDYYWFTP